MRLLTCVVLSLVWVLTSSLAPAQTPPQGGATGGAAGAGGDDSAGEDGKKGNDAPAGNGAAPTGGTKGEGGGTLSANMK